MGRNNFATIPGQNDEGELCSPSLVSVYVLAIPVVAADADRECVS